MREREKGVGEGSRGGKERREAFVAVSATKQRSDGERREAERRSRERGRKGEAPSRSLTPSLSRFLALSLSQGAEEGRRGEKREAVSGAKVLRR